MNVAKTCTPCIPTVKNDYFFQNSIYVYTFIRLIYTPLICAFLSILQVQYSDSPQTGSSSLNS